MTAYNMQHTPVSLFRVKIWADIEFRVPYSHRYLFNAIADTNHNANRA